MAKLSTNYIWFQILITLIVAFVFLADRLKDYLITDIYLFLKNNRDIFIGIYYLYLAYELYRRFIIEKDF